MTDKEIKISVIIPMYNREKTIHYCLQSVLNQTYQAAEIIVVDDCSVDSSVDIVKSLNNPLIRLIILERNSGAQVARNRGIKESRYDWIAFQDSDDEWLPDRLEKGVAELKKRNYNLYTMVYSNCNRIYTETNKCELWELQDFNGFNTYPLLLRWPAPMFQGMLVSKKALVDIGYLDETIKTYQEWDTSIRLSKICELVHIKAPLFNYYIHQGETISKNPANDIDGYGFIIEKFKSDIFKIQDTGSDIWLHHITLQIKRSLELKLWKHAAKYVKQYPLRNRTYLYFVYCVLTKSPVGQTPLDRFFNIIKKAIRRI